MVYDKVDSFRTLMSENDHLLGNFSAKQIGAIAKARHTVSDFVQDSTTNLQKITEQSKPLKNVLKIDSFV